MSAQAIERVLDRVIREPVFRERIRENPARALRGYNLTLEERTVLLRGDANALEACGVDPRMSRVPVF
jgi:hypothetical protein